MAAPIRSFAGGYSRLNLTGNTNVFTGQCVVRKVIVAVTAAAASTIIDSTGTSATAANTILVIPASTTAGTIYTLDFPCSAGLSVLAGASVTLNVTFDDASG